MPVAERLNGGLQEALAERRVDFLSRSFATCGFRECSALIALSTSTQRVQAVLDCTSEIQASHLRRQFGAAVRVTVKRMCD